MKRYRLRKRYICLLLSYWFWWNTQIYFYHLFDSCFVYNLSLADKYILLVTSIISASPVSMTSSSRPQFVYPTWVQFAEVCCIIIQMPIMFLTLPHWPSQNSVLQLSKSKILINFHLHLLRTHYSKATLIWSHLINSSNK